MKDMDKKKEPLPEEFASEEEAGAFWDTHSTADYEEYLEPVDITIDLRTRHYLIEIDKEIFLTLFQYSQQMNQSVQHLASDLLKAQLISIHREHVP
jgi:hypothetical protein